MAPKKNLYETGVGIAVVGGDNSIQRHFGFVLWWGFTMVAGANSSTTLTTTLLQRRMTFNGWNIPRARIMALFTPFGISLTF
ncbi:MAG TPA: hypothetical protein VLA46_05910 [Saprospiraceae bacterium]|nr:hypothetical protein [Saprospiraceae bacterium]